MTIRQPQPPSIRLENIAVVRGSRLVLNRLSLEADAGDIVWVRGANGCGKSTLLRLVAGLLNAASGSAGITGAVALSDENPALDPALRLEDALAFWAKLDDAPASRRDAALVAMDLIGLTEVPVRYLSTGQRKRAGLARVIASSAPIWLLDEPYNGLDSASSARLDAALLAHSKGGGIALVAAHHSPTVNVALSIALDAATNRHVA